MTKNSNGKPDNKVRRNHKIQCNTHEKEAAQNELEPAKLTNEETCVTLQLINRKTFYVRWSF
uniref:Uncharacterized protein n=1 Tax=Vibrio genomosp. F6 TaxID=723172 RepID=A0A0H3ZSL9_9VIBR|nr:hypothetical protein [Vibrio genomosp. F6]